jgi:site-specific DNA recombinase
MPAPKTAWIYVRESGDDSASGHNPENQERLCRELAAERGYFVERVLWEVESARTAGKRKVWLSIRKAMRRHVFDVLVVWKYSRLHRNFVNQARMVAEARASGVEVLSQQEPFDRGSKYGRMMLYYVGIYNEFESDTIREQAMAGTLARVHKGMPLVGARKPYGYIWKEEYTVSRLTGAGRVRKTTLMVDEIEATVVRKIFSYLDQPNISLNACASWLNSQGIPSPTGKLWRRSSLEYLVKQSYYWGEPYAYRTVLLDVPVTDALGDVELEKRPRKRPLEERIPLPPDSVPAIIDKRLVLRVKARLAERRESFTMPQHLVNNQYLLTGGLIRCSICGGKMGALARRGRNPAYGCSTGQAHPVGDARKHHMTIRAKDADAYAIGMLVDILENQEKAEAAIRRLFDQKAEVDTAKLAAEQQKAEAERELATLKKLRSTLGPEDVQDFALDYHRAKEQLRDAEQRLAAYGMADQTAERLYTRLLSYIEAVRQHHIPPVVRLHPVEDREELREMLFALGGNVIVLPGERYEYAKRLTYQWQLGEELSTYPVQQRTR